MTLVVLMLVLVLMLDRRGQLLVGAYHTSEFLQLSSRMKRSHAAGGGMDRMYARAERKRGRKEGRGKERKGKGRKGRKGSTSSSMK